MRHTHACESSAEGHLCVASFGLPELTVGRRERVLGELAFEGDVQGDVFVDLDDEFLSEFED